MLAKAKHLYSRCVTNNRKLIITCIVTLITTQSWQPPLAYYIVRSGLLLETTANSTRRLEPLIITEDKCKRLSFFSDSIRYR